MMYFIIDTIIRTTMMNTITLINITKTITMKAVA